LSALGFEEGTNIGRIGGRLLAKEKRTRSAKELAAEIREQVMKLPGVERYSASAVSVIQKAFLGGGRPISIEVLGHDIETTDEIAEKIRGIVETTPGTADVSVSRKKPRPEVQIRLDRDRAATLGLNVALLADALRTNYYGFKDSKFREAGDDFEIELRLKRSNGRVSVKSGKPLSRQSKVRPSNCGMSPLFRKPSGPWRSNEKTGTESPRLWQVSKGGSSVMWQAIFKKR